MNTFIKSSLGIACALLLTGLAACGKPGDQAGGSDRGGAMTSPGAASSAPFPASAPSR